MNIAILGAPGVGKGTQAAMLAETYGMKHISSGDLLRAEVKRGTELGKEIAKIISGGNLVSTELITRLIKQEMGEYCVFDGYPRTLEQAQLLDELVPDLVVIHLVAPEEVILNRLGGRKVCRDCGATYHTSQYKKDTCNQCGGELYVRADDTLSAIKVRLDTYYKQIQPILEYYPNVIEIDVSHEDKLVNAAKIKEHLR